MFTGLIEEIGTIKDVKMSSNGCTLVINCKKILETAKIGDSISVNGVCQTIVEKSSDYFKTELSNETLKVSNFNKISIGNKVNLERAIMLSSRLDGHIVNGHIDCLAVFLSSKKDGFSEILTFEIDDNFKKYLLYKASISINGVSLTISNVNDNKFSIAAIPTTLELTNLGLLKNGTEVNIEIDILAKYIEKFLSLDNNITTTIDNKFLEMNGFI